MEAWLVDALAATGYRGLLDRVFARGQQITGAAMLVGTVGGGLLGQIDLSLPVPRPDGAARRGLRRRLRRHARRRFRAAARHRRRAPRRDREERESRRRVRLAAAHAPAADARAAVQLGLFSCGRSTRRSRTCSSSSTATRSGSPGSSPPAIALSTIAGNQVVRVASRYCGQRTTLLLAAAAIETVAAITVGLAGLVLGRARRALLVMVASGVTSPVRSAYLHQVVPAEQRATVVSFDSMVSSAGGIGGQIGLGVLGEARCVGSAFVVGGVATAGALPLLARLRRLGGAADVIAGERAGADGPCAASGLPAVSRGRDRAARGSGARRGGVASRV